MSIPVIGITGLTGWTVVQGAASESAGVITPDVPANTTTLIYDTALAETNTDAVNGTKGSQIKITIGGGLEFASTIRAIISYVDIDNYVFAEFRKGMSSGLGGVTDDRVRLGVRVAGVEAWFGASRALLRRQTEYGHLRHYRLEAGGTIWLQKVLDQYIVRMSLTDPADGLDPDDLIVLHETTGSATATSRKVGFQFVGSTHTNSVTQVQAGLFTCHFSDKVSGNDSTGNGSSTSPYAEITQLARVTLADQIGILRNVGSNYTGHMDNEYNAGELTLPTGTNWEDTPVIMSEASGRVTQRVGTTGTRREIKIKAGSVRYRTFYRLILSGGNESQTDVGHSCITVWGQELQSTTALAHHHRFQELDVGYGTNAAGINFNIGVTYTGVAPYDVLPTQEQCKSYAHFLDCVSHDHHWSNVLGSHGFYLPTGGNLIEYCESRDNNGAGGKFYNDVAGIRDVPACVDNVLRFTELHDNVFTGWNIGYALRDRVHSNVSHHNGTVLNDSKGGGFAITYGNNDTRWYNNHAYLNFGAGFLIDTAFGTYSSTNCKIFHNTFYKNDYGIWLRTGFSNPEPSGFQYNSNSCYLNTTDWYEPSVDQTTPTYTTNHETADVGSVFGSIFGNPNFVDPDNGDFHLTTGSILKSGGSDTNTWRGGDVDYDGLVIPQVATLFAVGAHELAASATAPMLVVPATFSLVAGTPTTLSGISATLYGGGAAKVGLSFSQAITVQATASGTAVVQGSD